MSHRTPRRALPTLGLAHLRAGVAMVIAAGMLAISAGSAQAASPFWRVRAEGEPASDVPPGGETNLVIAATNEGATQVNGGEAPIVVNAALPNGLTATKITGGATGAVPAECTLATLTCTYTGVLAPYEQIAITITVQVAASVAPRTTLTGRTTVAGGGAATVSHSVPVAVETGPPLYGLSGFEVTPVTETGAPATQAGAHPFEVISALKLNHVNGQPVSQPKDFAFTLPAGLVGNPMATAQCSMVDFYALVHETNLCSPASVVGVATVTANEPKFAHIVTATVPVFNLVPNAAEPARLGFEVIGKFPVVIDATVRSGADYAVVARVENADQTAGLLSANLTLWGVPGAASHNAARGWECVAGGAYDSQVGKACPAEPHLEQKPFLTLPTSCGEPVVSSVESDSWGQPGSFVGESYEWMSPEGARLGFEGCSKLPFAPSVGMATEASDAATPTGVTVSVRVPQASTLEPEGLAEADVKDSTVSLPVGMELSPSAANGLGACSEAQIGFTGFSGAGMAEFSGGAPECPAAAKLGIVHVKTPLLEHELEGTAYLAAQNANPFGSLVALYIYAQDPVSGVWVKLAGRGELNEATGQVTTTFADTPQVPFEELRLELFGGPRASVSTPVSCGAYAPTGVFTPWSGGGAVTASTEGFSVEQDVGGGPCLASVPFTPTFAAQSANTQAGGFTTFTVEITRPDGDQALTGVSVHLPPGIAALLSSVTPCAEPPEGAEWACGEASLIGHSEAWSGLGTEPVTLPGDVYLTTGYDGAPFGILVRTHAAAGPFDLGYVNVRSRVNVNPTDASVTITTDPGPHGDTLPVRLKGIPAQIKALEITVDRPGFEFNPTSCNPMSITGSLSGDQGASAPVSSHFQVGGCERLPFAPVLTATTPGQGSRANGTAFNVKITSAGLGQANIAQVDLRLPKELPTRQSTIKLACPEATFDANPASCDEGSVIGSATVRTPVLKDPLTGPAYLVSHGGAKFPDVEFVLQGEGVKLILDGSTDIKEGYTYSRFEATPDAPFTSFETTLPAGPHSALGVYVPEKENYSVCKTTLTMPTRIVSQTGKVIEQETKIAPTGCSGVLHNKTVKLSTAQKLAKALAKCRKRYKHNKHRRQTCERQAHKKYPTTKNHTKRPRRTHRAHR